MNNAALYSQAYHYIRCVYKGHRALLRRLIPSHDTISWVSDNLRESCYLPNLTVLSPKNNSRTIGPLLHAGRLPVDRSVEVNFASQPRGFAMHLVRLLPYMLSSMPTQKMPEKVLRTTLILMLCSLKHRCCEFSLPELHYHGITHPSFVQAFSAKQNKAFRAEDLDRARCIDS